MDAALDLIHSSSFYEFALLLFLAAAGGAIGTMLRQPLIIAFIIIGVLVGPSALGIVNAQGEIALLAKLGIAILLFIVGLKLDLTLIRNLGSVAFIIGMIQMALTIALGAGISILLGFGTQTALMIGVALAFSSTIIIIKVLSDKREIDSLHGRIALGVLIVQDLAVVFAMIVLSALGSTVGADETAGSGIAEALLNTVLYTGILLAVLAVFMRYAAMNVVSFVAKNQELLLCFAIAWALALAALCDAMGLSKELGGLLAGISLASTPYREAIIARLASLRDFLLLFFFITLGTQIDLGILSGVVIPALVLAGFVLVFKPLIIMILCGALGYRKRTGFLAGVSLAQISEFSLIFAALAYGLGFLTQEVLGLVTLVALITIVLSTYAILLSHVLYGIFEPALDIFERRNADKEEEEDTEKVKKSYDIILFGLGRYGRAMAREFVEAGKSLLAVDFNPEEIKRAKKEKFDVIYGDANDTEFFHKLPLEKAQWVVSALPQHHHDGVTHEDPRLMILQGLREAKYKGKKAVACHHEDSATKFKRRRVDAIFMPYHDAARQAAETVLAADKAEQPSKPARKKKKK